MKKSERKGMPPIKVAKKIYKAIKSKKPRMRYPVGFQAHVVALLTRILPPKALRYAIMWMYQVPRK